MSTPTGPNDPGSAYPPHTGGGGSEVLVSGTAMAFLFANYLVPVPGQTNLVELASAPQIKTGDDYWGEPGTGMPLAMTINDNDQFAYPAAAEDHVYDVLSQVTVDTDAADIGKPIQVTASGGNGFVTTEAVVRALGGNGRATAAFSWTDAVFKGATDAAIMAAVNLSLLAEPLPGSSINVTHLVMQR